MSNSKIEWTEQTWNPIVGCSLVSPGCTNCYAMAMAARNERMGVSRYDGLTREVNGRAVWTGKVARAPESTLLAPLKRRKRTTYFVNSMSDLFHEDVPDAWIDEIFATMGESPQHIFQILTKRADRMRRYMIDVRDRRTILAGAFAWPLPNVWLGVSTERQQEADERIPLLLQTPAAVRFISAEPLLGPIDLTRIAAPKVAPDDNAEGWKFNCLDAPSDYYELWVDDPFREGPRCIDSGDGPYRETALDWVIVGGESGLGARPMNPDWARALRDQCQTAGVPFFFKQWGEFSDREDCDGNILRVGKRAAGRLLDGVEHNAMPGKP